MERGHPLPLALERNLVEAGPRQFQLLLAQARLRGRHHQRAFRWVAQNAARGRRAGEQGVVAECPDAQQAFQRRIVLHRNRLAAGSNLAHRLVAIAVHVVESPVRVEA